MKKLMVFTFLLLILSGCGEKTEEIDLFPVVSEIERVRIGAATDAAYGIRKETQLSYHIMNMEGTSYDKIVVAFDKEQIDAKIYDGTDSKGQPYDFELDGMIPRSGKVTIYSDGTIEFENIVINDFKCTIPEAGEIICKK